jgi:hypothetical protein
MRTLCATIAVVVVLFASLPGQSSAGILDDFEDDATSKSESDTTDSKGSSNSFMDSCFSGCLESVFSSMIESLWKSDSDDVAEKEEKTSAPADSLSFHTGRVRLRPPLVEPPEGSSLPEPRGESPFSPSPETSVSAESLLVQPPEIPSGSSVPEQRVQESFQLPTLYVDIRYQGVESDVNAFDGGLEVGYEFVGADFRYTHYVEDDPPDELDVYQWHGLLRWAATDKFEIGLGCGTMTLSGNNSTTGASLTVPVRITFEAPAAFVFRPSWSWLGDNTVSSYDATAHYLWPSFSAFLGYRLFSSGRSSLNGASAGVAVRF